LRPNQTVFDFTIVVLEGQYPTGLSITRDMLMVAELLAPRLGLIKPRWRICSLDGGTIKLQGGLSIETSPLCMDNSNDRSTWIMSGLGLNNAQEVHQRLKDDDISRLANVLASHIKAGAKVAAACSAVFSLHAAGLLSGRRVTTTWWLAPLLQNLEPNCRVDADRMVCADGPIITSGAAFAQTDLMIHLLRDKYGNELVTEVSRMLLIDNRVAQQASFIVPEFFASGDELLSRIIEHIEHAIPDVPSVEKLATEFCMTERTLLRHVQRATGKSTSALIQNIRFRRARTMLENSRLTIEQVAEAVGYEDATSLRKMIKKITGTNPRRAYKPAVN